jgi:O-antigen chain-terminating methyltransferase
MTDAAALLALHASMPEPRQPAWGLGAGSGAARRVHDERVATLLPLLEALPHDGVLRILDVDCAQGYFTLAVAQALATHGRAVEIVGVDRDARNIEFCEALAAYHGLPVRFVRATCDAEFLERKEDANWDAALVLGVSPDTADVEAKESTASLALLRQHSRIILGEIPEGSRLPWSGDCRPAAQGFFRRLARFEAAPGGTARCVYACSDHLAWVGGQWFAFEHAIDRSHAGVPESFVGQRRFFIGARAVVKAFRGDGRHGAFNRAELAAEARALEALQGEPDRYPSVLAQADDGDVVWLARDCLPGELLSERMLSGGIDRDAAARGLLRELAHLESRGFYHADLRCWNVLLDGDDIRLIDFGALVRTPSALQRLALCAVLLEIARGEAGHEQPFYAAVPPIDAYPPAWQRAIRYVLGTPQPEFRYEETLRILLSSSEVAPGNDAAVVREWKLDDELLTSAGQELCEAFRRLREHDEAMERALAAAEYSNAAELAEVTALRARAHELEHARRRDEKEHAKHADSLTAALAKSQSYADSLEARLAREAADARAEREAMEAARRAASEYADSLKSSLDISREYADSLRASLEESQAYASSLGERLDALQAKHLRMQRRFRLLKFLWPREPQNPKESE